MNNFFSLKDYIEPIFKKQSDGLGYWREKLINYLVFVIFIFAFIAYIPSVYLSIISDLWSIVILDTIIYVLIAFLFFRRNLNFKTKLYTILAGSYVLGVLLILTLGIYGAGYLWLFVLPVLAGALLKGKAARYIVVINAVTMIALGLLQYFGWSLLINLEAFSLGSWLIISANFIFLNIICTLTVVFIINGIEITINNEKKISKTLEQTNREVIKAKEDAEVADKLKTEFLTQISHEIRTPLNTIVNFSSIIAEYDDPDIRTFTKSIDGAAKRIIRTVEHLLNMSDVMTSTYKPYKREINVCEDVISIVAPEYKTAAEHKGILFQIKNNADNCIIQGDDHALGQIISNLLDNAVKYTEVGKVELVMFNRTEALFIEVIDTGIGISDEYIKKIFSPFSQEATGYTRKYDGVGLGLSLVKSYCDLNNIELDIDSIKHHGTKITLRFRL